MLRFCGFWRVVWFGVFLIFEQSKLVDFVRGIIPDFLNSETIHGAQKLGTPQLNIYIYI